MWIIIINCFQILIKTIFCNPFDILLCCHLLLTMQFIFEKHHLFKTCLQKRECNIPYRANIQLRENTLVQLLLLPVIYIAKMYYHLNQCIKMWYFTLYVSQKYKPNMRARNVIFYHPTIPAYPFIFYCV